MNSATAKNETDANLAKSAKGERKRALILDAALRIIARDGHYQLTLRNVGVEADCGHAAVRYYFGSRDALMCAASEFAGEYIAGQSQKIVPKLEAAADSPSKFGQIIARHNVEMLIKNRDMGLVVFELNFAAAREEYLRPIIYKWGRTHSRLFAIAFEKLGSRDPASDYSFLLNTINGLMISQLFLPRRDFESKILCPAVERLTMSIASAR